VDTSLKQISIEDGINGYVDLVRHVLHYGEAAAPRGIKTYEIEDATIYIDNVYNTLPIGVGRGTVPGIGAVEATQLLSGTSYPETVIAVGPQFSNYTEDDGKFHGSYGTRTNGQYSVMIDRLKKDPYSRQCVVTIWNPERDMLEKKRDYPCTILHQFRIRDNKLNMSVYMRSNDVWLGAAYDFFQFTRVQLAMCSVLGIEPGTYAHHVGSLHIYETNCEAAGHLIKTDTIEPIPYFTGRTWDEVMASAHVSLTAVHHEPLRALLTPTELWYTDAMLKAVNKNIERKTVK
jgi:thymidylate synthase